MKKTSRQINNPFVKPNNPPINLLTKVGLLNEISTLIKLDRTMPTNTIAAKIAK
jgi:hypothetical protein